MPRSKPPRKGDPWSRNFTPQGFINIRLSDEQREDFSAWYEGREDCMRMWFDSLEFYKLGLSYNSDQDTFYASMTCKFPASPQYGYTLSAFARSLERAVGMLVWKHYILLEEHWPLDGQMERPAEG